MSGNRAVVASAGVTIALATVGCASTVQRADSRVVVYGESGSSGTPGTAVAGGGTDSLGVPGPAGAVGAGPGVSTGGAAGGAALGNGGGAAATAGRTGGDVVQGVGVTPSAVHVGVVYFTNGDAANAALGAADLTQGDTKADAQAVIDDINAHGGVAGRKLEPVWYAFDQTSTQSYASIDQAMCATFTQDNHVLAVAGGGLTDTFIACLTKAGTFDVEAPGYIIDHDKAYFDRWSSYYNVGVLTQDRMMAQEVRTLARRHYFDGWNTATARAGQAGVKVGILSFDNPEWNRPLDRVLLPALARLGRPAAPGDVVRVTYPQSEAQTGQSVAEIQSAVLHFRGDGVTHVIILDANGSMTLQFLQNAKSQHYYPRLGVNSATGIEALYSTGLVAAQQLAGAVGLGWSPSLDLSAAAGATYATPATRHCLHVIRQRTGQTFSSTNAASVALSYCDELYFIADAVDHADPVINRDTSRAAIEAFGTSFPAAGFPELRFAPGRHDGVEIGFDLVWDSTCTCTRYEGRGYDIP